MATSKEFMDFICDQAQEWNPRSRKMFGEYMVYVNDKPLLLICDETVYVKKLECVASLLSDAPCGSPYEGAKEHYIVDADDRELLNDVIRALEPVIPVPAKRKKKTEKKQSEQE